jgi:hypothetical protein
MGSSHDELEQNKSEELEQNDVLLFFFFFWKYDVLIHVNYDCQFDSYN